MRKGFEYARIIIAAIALTVCVEKVHATPAPKAGYFELKVYHFSNTRQEALIDSFLQYQFMPSLKGAGINYVGVFKPMANDTAADKRVYVFTPYKTLKQWEKTKLNIAGGGYVDAPYNFPAFNRVEGIFMQAFPFMSRLTDSKLTAPKSERVYELRSYESPSERYYRSKVKMFNQGGEIDIFSRLGFNAVFYGDVLFGTKMPNLMYMTSFENMKSRDEHWKAFGSDPAWKTLSGMEEYQHNVSKSEIVFLRPAEYSDL